VSPDFASLRFGYKLPELRKKVFIRCCKKRDWSFCQSAEPQQK
jgi:hypothetical protein